MSERLYTTRPQPCPCCGHPLNASTARLFNGAGGGPEAGDFTICIRCAGLLRFGEGLVLREATEEDLWPVSFEDRGQLEALQRAVLASSQYRA
jgi:hypothetical protein